MSKNMSKVTYKRSIPQPLGNDLKAVIPISLPVDKNLFYKEPYNKQSGQLLRESLLCIANDKRIAEICILLTDALQIENIKAIFNCDDNTAYQRIKEICSYWEKINQPYINEFKNIFKGKFSIKYWDFVNKEIDYQKTLLKIENLYSDEKNLKNGFTQKVNSRAGEFASRYEQLVRELYPDIIYLNVNELKNASKRYIKNESAGRIILGNFFDIEFYIEDIDPPMETACARFSNNKPMRIPLKMPRVKKNKAKNSVFLKHEKNTDVSNVLQQQEIKNNFYNAILSLTKIIISDKDNITPQWQLEFLVKYNVFLNNFFKNFQNVESGVNEEISKISNRRSYGP